MIERRRLKVKDARLEQDNRKPADVYFIREQNRLVHGDMTGLQRIAKNWKSHVISLGTVVVLYSILCGVFIGIERFFNEPNWVLKDTVWSFIAIVLLVIIFLIFTGCTEGDL